MKSKQIPESPAAFSPAHTPLSAKILVRGIHLELTAALRDATVEKTSRLLIAAGLARQEGGAVLPRCPLYASYFGEHLDG